MLKYAKTLHSSFGQEKRNYILTMVTNKSVKECALNDTKRKDSWLDYSGHGSLFRGIIIIFDIYIAQISIQEDMIKCALNIKIESRISMLPIYNFAFRIKCEDVYYMKH